MKMIIDEKDLEHSRTKINELAKIMKQFEIIFDDFYNIDFKNTTSKEREDSYYKLEKLYNILELNNFKELVDYKVNEMFIKMKECLPNTQMEVNGENIEITLSENFKMTINPFISSLEKYRYPQNKIKTSLKDFKSGPAITDGLNFNNNKEIEVTKKDFYIIGLSFDCGLIGHIESRKEELQKRRIKNDTLEKFFSNLFIKGEIFKVGNPFLTYNKCIERIKKNNKEEIENIYQEFLIELHNAEFYCNEYLHYANKELELFNKALDNLSKVINLN